MNSLDGLSAALADRYRIERELGAGGMATVYLAEDLKHQRKVAVKVLREDLSASLGGGRFLREIKIAAQLQHPNILPLLDSGEAGGFLFYVMPYVAGQSLRERIAREGELPVHEAVRLITEVVDALAHAHEHGVVHRDIKPDNVMLSGRHALVTDFGVAKAISEATGRNTVTTLGVAVGTPNYMSPEQAAADPNIDHRSDIYAVGVMAYELLTGRPPFTGGTPQQVLAAHITEAPDSVTKRRPAISPALDAIILRCLAKHPADRFQSAQDLLAQLEPLATPSGGMTPSATRPMPAATAISTGATWGVIPRWAFAALGVVILGGGGYFAFRRIADGRSTAGAQSVAVLPFENVGGDSANMAFTDGIQGEILTDLTRVAALQVTSRSSVQEYRKTSKPVKQVGTELGVRTLLQGQVQRAGNQVHVTVQLVDAPSDRQIWAESYNRELTAQNVFTIQSDIAHNVADALRASFTATQTAAAEKAPTSNLAALDWYHRGQQLFDDRSGATDDTSSIRAFERAVALDSTFAQAWAGLAASRSWRVRTGTMTDTVPARTALDHAIALDPSSSETMIAQAYFEYYARGAYDAALGHFKAVAAVRPNDVNAIAGVGYISRRRGRWDDALAAGQKVIVLDPRNLGAMTDLAFTYLCLRRYDRAEEIVHRVLIADPTNEGALSWLILSAVAGRGDTAAGRMILSTLPPGTSPQVRNGIEALLARLAHHYDASSAATDRVPPQGPADAPSNLISRAMNDVAVGMQARARARADSAARLARTYLAKNTGGDIFGNRAVFHTALGIAEAIMGDGAAAIRDGERAVELNPSSRDATAGPNSIAGLIVIHLLLGRRDDAIRLTATAAHEAVGSQGVIPITQGVIRLEPIFDGIRDDPRIRALLQSDSAWVVR